MSAQIIDAECIRNSDGCARETIHGVNTYACNRLAMWMLQRLPGQLGRWYVSLNVRGLAISTWAVQDDFGNLQVVEV